MEQARDTARALIAELTGETKPLPLVPETPKATVSEFAVRFLDHGTPSWKPATLKAHRSLLACAILPQFGVRDIASITAQEVASWFARARGSQGTRNRALAVLSGMMRHAEILGLRPPGSNPCQGLRRRKNRFEVHRLSEQDYGRLGKALRRIEDTEPAIAALIRFLALTGCRKSEARLLRWDMLDANRAALPDSKTGPRAIWLGRAALSLVAEQPLTCAFVFSIKDKPVSPARIAKVWAKVRIEIGLPVLRLHDLRHGFASVAISSGEALRTVSGLLGHSELQTTAGYAQFSEAPVRQAAERVAEHLERTLSQRVPRVMPEPPPMVAAFFAQSMSVRDFAAQQGVSLSTLRQKVGAYNRARREALSKVEAS
ncbi:phage integrase family site-specific recombinase [Hyphomonas oceanitis SCH89]|uniref:Phage integrase family site-specific recombinase n=1 Tax=Hyphomonas oceanitis SCH89 TaxID=1280953 RepID=A0A059G5C3_9PROT|nr:phage integrase family site-specific recombinase [Hyphomonas oceanitis SCH89]